MDIQTFADFKVRYKFDESQAVGTGGFAAVYKGLDTLTGRTVAIKKSLVNPDRQKYSLYEEVQTGQSLRHPNLVEYLEVYRFTGDHGVFDYGVLEFVNGGTLSDFLKTEPSHPQIKSVLLGILEGLKYLHERNIIHRDLKPANILIHYEGGRYVPKIIDFGISKGLSSEESTVSNIVGSWQYMSPEQISPLPGEKIRTNSDLWSFGVIVYEIFTGKPAFGSTKSGDTQERIRGRILDGNLPEDVVRIPQPFQNVIRSCLVKHPDQRATKADQLAQLISGYNPEDVTISSQKTEVSTPVAPPVVVPPPLPPQPPQSPPPSHPRPHAQYVPPAPGPVPPRPAPSQKSSASWWQPAMIISGIAVILSFFLPMIKDSSDSSAFNQLKAILENPDILELMTSEGWLLLASYILVVVSGVLLLVSGLKGGKGFVIGMVLLAIGITYISYQYFTQFDAPFGDVIKVLGIGYWIPVGAFILMVVLSMAARGARPAPVISHSPPPAPVSTPAHQPAQYAPHPVQPAPRARRRFPVGLVVILVLLGGLGVAGWFITDGFTRMPGGEKSKEQLIIGSWKMYQVFEDFEYRMLEDYERITVEFRKDGSFYSSDGDEGYYRVEGDRLIVESDNGDESVAIKVLDDDNLRLEYEAGATEMSFRRL